MTHREWLLLLLAVPDASAPLDPVRIQKGMFLLAREGGVPPGESYIFRAYDYGPFSAQIYDDLEDLVDEGFIEEEPVPNYTWSRYRPTADGMAYAEEIANSMTEFQRESLRFLATTKQDVLSLGFNRLLRYVYRRHPHYARNSIFSG
jgi:uncharacterized protein YwgA